MHYFMKYLPMYRMDEFNMNLVLFTSAAYGFFSHPISSSSDYISQ